MDQKVATAFLLKLTFLKRTQKLQHFWATLVSKFVAKTHKNSPILSHWLGTQNWSQWTVNKLTITYCNLYLKDFIVLSHCCDHHAWLNYNVPTTLDLLDEISQNMIFHIWIIAIKASFQMKSAFGSRGLVANYKTYLTNICNTYLCDVKYVTLTYRA